MPRKIATLIYLCIITLSAMNAFSQQRQIKVGAPFLTITPDARSAGYGDQGVATSPDNNSQYWNPAKYIFSTSYTGASYSFTPWLHNIADNISLHYMSGFYKFSDKQAVSASLRYFSLGEVPITDNNGNVSSNANANEFSVDVAYSRKLSENLSAGIGFRYIRSDLTGSAAIPDLTVDNKAASSFAADVSIYYTKKVANNEWAIGANIANIGQKISYGNTSDKSFIPTNLKLGGRFTHEINESNKISFLAETSKLLVPTPDYDENGKDKNADKSVIQAMFTSFGDAPGGFSEEMKEFVYSLGAEYMYRDFVALRAGYFHEAETKGNRKFVTFGIGLHYQILSFDIAYLAPTSSGSNSPLDNTFRFTLGFNLK